MTEHHSQLHDDLCLLRRVPAGVCLSLWLGLVIAASLAPPGPAAGQAHSLSPLAFLGHFGAYAVLSWLVFWTFRTKRAALWLAPMVVAPLVLGVLLEVLQPLVGRTRDVWDVVANAGGVAAALCLRRRLWPVRPGSTVATGRRLPPGRQGPSVGRPPAGVAGRG